MAFSDEQILAALSDPNVPEARKAELRKRFKRLSLDTGTAGNAATDAQSETGKAEAAFRNAIPSLSDRLMAAAPQAAITAAEIPLVSHPAMLLPGAFLLLAQTLFGGKSKSDIPAAFRPEYAVGDKQLSQEIPGFADLPEAAQKRIATVLEATGSLHGTGRGDPDKGFALKGKPGVDTSYTFADLGRAIPSGGRSQFGPDTPTNLDEYIAATQNPQTGIGAPAPKLSALYDYIQAEKQGISGDELRKAYERVKPFTQEVNEYGGIKEKLSSDANPAMLYDDLSALSGLDPDYADMVDRRNAALIQNLGEGQNLNDALANVSATDAKTKLAKVQSSYGQPGVLARAGLPVSEAASKFAQSSAAPFIQMSQPFQGNPAAQLERNTGVQLSLDPEERKKQVTKLLARDPTLRAQQAAFLSLGAGLTQ
jgi:hypothetical protein